MFPLSLPFDRLNIVAPNPRRRSLVLAVLLALSVSCGLPTKSFGNDILKIGTDVWLPYENISNTTAPGFSTEVIKEVLKRMKVEHRIKELPWARGLEDVYSGKRDALYTAFWTDERASFCHYPDEPLASEKWVFFVRKKEAEELSFSSLDEIRGRRIGILRGASVTDEFWEFVKKNSNYEEVETDDLNFKKLQRGRLDYVVTSYSNGQALLQTMGLSDTIGPLLSPVVKEDDLFIIFSKKTVDSGFVERFSNVLRDFKKTETHEAIIEKYFGGGGQ